MAQYGMILTHPPNICPMSNKASREMAKKGFSQMPDLAQKHKVKMISLYHFDPEHMAVGIFEADNIESVRDMLLEAGMSHWNNLQLYPVTPVEKLMKEIDNVPTIF